VLPSAPSGHTRARPAAQPRAPPAMGSAGACVVAPAHAAALRRKRARRGRGSAATTWLLPPLLLLLAPAVAPHGAFVASGGRPQPRAVGSFGPLGTGRGVAATGPRRAQPEASADQLLEEANRLRGEAEAAKALLEAQKALRLEKERMEELKRPTPEQEVATVTQKLEDAQTKLRKAEAFALPEAGELKREVAALESRKQELQAQMEAATAPPPAPAPPPEAERPVGLNRNGKPMAEWTDKDWEDLSVAEDQMNPTLRFELAKALGKEGRERLTAIRQRKRDERWKEEEKEVKQQEALWQWEEEKRQKDEEKRKATLRDQARGLRSRLSFERLKEMSNEERLEVAKDAGPAYVIALALVALCYWALNVPFLVLAYHESTGLWPDVSNLESLGSLQAAGAFAGIFAMYALLKPVRLFVALLVTPWTVENVMPNVPGWQLEDKGKQ